MPTTALRTNRLLASKATWSQQSPQRDSSAWQCFCFLPTNDHFSSSWTSWVVGGKSHEFVVALLGVGAGPQSIADDRVFIDARQPSGLAHAAAILEVLEDGQGLVVGEADAEEGTAFAFGEAGLAGAADEQAALLGGAVAEADAEVVAAAHAVVRALGVLATKQTEVIHRKRLTDHKLRNGQVIFAIVH